MPKKIISSYGELQNAIQGIQIFNIDSTETETETEEQKEKKKKKENAKKRKMEELDKDGIPYLKINEKTLTFHENGKELWSIGLDEFNKAIIATYNKTYPPYVSWQTALNMFYNDKGVTYVYDQGQLSNAQIYSFNQVARTIDSKINIKIDKLSISDVFLTQDTLAIINMLIKQDPGSVADSYKKMTSVQNQIKLDLLTSIFNNPIQSTLFYEKSTDKTKLIEFILSSEKSISAFAKFLSTIKIRELGDEQYKLCVKVKKQIPEFRWELIKAAITKPDSTANAIINGHFTTSLSRVFRNTSAQNTMKKVIQHMNSVTNNTPTANDFLASTIAQLNARINKYWNKDDPKCKALAQLQQQLSEMSRDRDASYQDIKDTISTWINRNKQVIEKHVTPSMFRLRSKDAPTDTKMWAEGVLCALDQKMSAPAPEETETANLKPH